MISSSSPYSFGPVSQGAWDQLVAASQSASVFNRRDFLTALGTDFHFWGVFDGPELMAATSVQTDEAGNVIGPEKSFNYYQGILLAPGITGLPSHSRIRRELAVVARLVEGLSGVYDEIWLCLHPRLKDIRALQWFNYHKPEDGQFQIDLRYTGVLELKDVTCRNDLLSLFARGRQGDYKKALAKGLTVKTALDAALLDDLHAKTFARQGAERGYLDQLLQPITQSALDNGFGELLVAYTPDGIAVSAALFIWDNSTSHYLFGASDPGYRSTGAATLVLAESLWRAIERGCAFADFVGINSPHRGEYKTSFGAVPVPYVEAHWQRPLKVEIDTRM